MEQLMRQGQGGQGPVRLNIFREKKSYLRNVTCVNPQETTWLDLLNQVDEHNNFTVATHEIRCLLHRSEEGIRRPVTKALDSTVSETLAAWERKPNDGHKIHVMAKNLGVEVPPPQQIFGTSVPPPGLAYRLRRPPVQRAPSLTGEPVGPPQQLMRAPIASSIYQPPQPRRQWPSTSTGPQLAQGGGTSGQQRRPANENQTMDDLTQANSVRNMQYRSATSSPDPPRRTLTPKNAAQQNVPVTNVGAHFQVPVPNFGYTLAQQQQQQCSAQMFAAHLFANPTQQQYLQQPRGGVMVQADHHHPIFKRPSPPPYINNVQTSFHYHDCHHSRRHAVVPMAVGGGGGVNQGLFMQQQQPQPIFGGRDGHGYNYAGVANNLYVGNVAYPPEPVAQQARARPPPPLQNFNQQAEQSHATSQVAPMDLSRGMAGPARYPPTCGRYIPR